MSLQPHDPAARRAAQRRAWSELIASADKLARRLIETDGEEAVEDFELRGMVRVMADETFPAHEESAKRAGAAFVLALRALLTAARPRRKAILAVMVKAGAESLDEVLTDVKEQEAAGWLAHTGEA
jgi:hypothetical protein